MPDLEKMKHWHDLLTDDYLQLQQSHLVAAIHTVLTEMVEDLLKQASPRPRTRTTPAAKP